MKVPLISVVLASAAAVVYFGTSHDDLHFPCHFRLSPIRWVPTPSPGPWLSCMGHTPSS